MIIFRQPIPAQDTGGETFTGVATRPSNLHVVIPASRGEQNLCKVLLSASILGYPSPVIINWGREFNDPDLVEGGSHLAKITGVHEYLLSLDETHDEDLMLMVDGYDIWLQLRPQTLLDRYFAINRKADQRIRDELGDVAAEQNILQEIIFGCQKRCWPWEVTDPPCYAVPNSTLPNDIYGPDTDTDAFRETSVENPYVNYRQRFLNSGVGIGTVRAMRKLFGQAKELALVESNIGSDQYIFSHIYGEQSVWREAVRRDAGAEPSPHTLGWPQEHFDTVRERANKREDKNFEFGIGVDHASEIGLNTVFAEDDTEWVDFRQPSQLRQYQMDRKIPPSRHRLNNASIDITNTLPPFWTFTGEDDINRWTGWDEVPLFTDVYTGITPVVIHHNAHREGLKSLRESWWEKIWFFPHARTLFDAYIYAPIVPVAISGYDEQTAREFWPYEIWKGGARNGQAALGSWQDDDWLRFDDICRESHEEVFRDGKGPWLLPDAH